MMPKGNSFVLVPLILLLDMLPKTSILHERLHNILSGFKKEKMLDSIVTRIRGKYDSEPGLNLL